MRHFSIFCIFLFRFFGGTFYTIQAWTGARRGFDQTTQAPHHQIRPSMRARAPNQQHDWGGWAAHLGTVGVDFSWEAGTSLVYLGLEGIDSEFRWCPEGSEEWEHIWNSRRPLQVKQTCERFPEDAGTGQTLGPICLILFRWNLSCRWLWKCDGSESCPTDHAGSKASGQSQSLVAEKSRLILADPDENRWSFHVCIRLLMMSWQLSIAHSPR